MTANTKQIDPFTVGDASVQIHADTCGTSTTYRGHCTLDCECWCHYPEAKDNR